LAGPITLADGGTDADAINGKFRITVATCRRWIRPGLTFRRTLVGSFVARKLMETQVLTVASPSYIKTLGRPRHPNGVEGCDCIDFYASARPYDWEVRRRNEVIPLRVKARLLVSDSGTLIGACEAGAGIAQILELGRKHLLDKAGW